MIQVGIIGAGSWGLNLVRTFHQLPNCKLARVVDPSPCQRQKVRAISDKIVTSGNSSDVTRSNAIDAVVVSSPAATHYEIAKDALLNGKHTFVEKPFVLKREQGEELTELAESRNLVLMVGHLLLYHPAVEKLKEYVQKNELGKLIYLCSIRINLGKIRRHENVLWSFAPHDISVMLYLMNQQPLVVNALGQSYLNHGIYDVVIFSLSFADNVFGYGQVSWLDPHKIRKITLVGDRKMVVFDDMEATEKVKIYDKGVMTEASYDSYGDALSLRFGDIHLPHLKMSEPLKNECLHFLNCIATNRRPLSDGYNGLQVLKILECAQSSLNRKGVPVEIN